MSVIEGEAVADRAELDQVVEELRGGRQAASHDPREPGRRRARVAARDAPDARAARQGLGDVHVAGRVPAAPRVPPPATSARSSARRPTTSASAWWSSSTAATSTACRSTSCRREGTHILNIDHHHDNTRFGTVNLVVARGLVHGRDRLRDRARARRRDHAADRRGALRRARHRHRPVHVREHHGRGAPDGRRADRGGRPAARDVPPAVRGPAVPPARAALAGAERASSATTTARSRWRHLTLRRLRGDRRARERLRGDRRPHARGRGHGGRRRSCASCSATSAGLAQGQPARHRRHGGRVADRARARRRRPPPGRRLLHRAADPDELVATIRERGRPSS